MTLQVPESSCCPSNNTCSDWNTYEVAAFQGVSFDGALLRTKAKARYETLGFPTRKNEAWKYIALNGVSATPFHQVPKRLERMTQFEAVAPQLAPHFLTSAVARLVFVDGFYSTELSDMEALPEGLSLTPFENGLDDVISSGAFSASAASHLERSLVASVDSEQDAFAALNLAMVNDGLVLHVAKTFERKTGPVQVLFYQSGCQKTEGALATYNRLCLSADEEAGLDLLIQVLEPNALPENSDSKSLSNVVVELDAAARSDVSITMAQQSLNATALFGLNYSFLRTRARLAEAANVSITSTALNTDVSRLSVEMNLLGESAHATLNGLNILSGKSQAYAHTEINHVIKECTSEQLFKGILDGESRSEFDGVITVHRDAQKTDSQQLNKNLILAEGATVFTRPQLKIDADDVKCAHGATVGELDEEELFYLISRGLSADVARCVLTFGFAEDALQSIAVPEIKSYLQAQNVLMLGQYKNPMSCFTGCETCPTGS